MNNTSAIAEIIIVYRCYSITIMPGLIEGRNSGSLYWKASLRTSSFYMNDHINFAQHACTGSYVTK